MSHRAQSAQGVSQIQDESIHGSMALPKVSLANLKNQPPTPPPPPASVKCTKALYDPHFIMTEASTVVK